MIGCARPHGRSRTTAQPLPPPPRGRSRRQRRLPTPLLDPSPRPNRTHLRPGQRELAEATSTRPGASSIGRSTSCSNVAGGARADARLRDHFDRLVDRISAQEDAALAEGDGFSEKPVRAGPDRRAARASTFDTPGRATPAAAAVHTDLALTATTSRSR